MHLETDEGKFHHLSPSVCAQIANKAKNTTINANLSLKKNGTNKTISHQAFVMLNQGYIFWFIEI